MSDPLDILDASTRFALRRAPDASWREPMLATLTDRPFSDPRWLFERKFDGVRAIATRDGDLPHLWSRNHRPMDGIYPEVVEALSTAAGPRFVVDGEIVTFSGEQTSFAKLQARINLTGTQRVRDTGVPIFYYLFDVLVLGEYDTTRLTQHDRKRVLYRAFDFRDPLRYSRHRDTHGEEYYRSACEQGWEGIIAKRADAPYRHGRSPNWLKFTCIKDQEFVIGGFTEPGGSRIGFGALLLGYYSADRLRYAGKVGTGYDDRTLRSLRARLDELVQPSSPFAADVPERGVHWVRPELVVRVRFTEWTSDGRLRHPRFTGVRTDKAAHEVVREM